MAETPRALLVWLRERIALEGSVTARREWLPAIEQTLKARPEDTPATLHVSSLLSTKDHVGRVEVTLGEFPPVQLEAQQAIDVANWLLHAATSAELDQFLFEWTRDAIGADAEKSGALVYEFREFREKRSAEWAAERAMYESPEP